MSVELASRYQQIMRRVLAVSDPSRKVTMIAVSKTQPVEAIEALYHLGHRDFGENYVQELVEKSEKLHASGCTEIRWHFIGHLQTNKVKALLPHVHTLHTVDSEKLGRELAKRWSQTHEAAGPNAPKLPCFIEVNIDHEKSKAGALPENTPALAATLSSESALSLQGLMAVPEATSHPGQSVPSFLMLQALERTCQPYTAGQLSMGMSNDFEFAIAAGATHVRVGTALFGKR